MKTKKVCAICGHTYIAGYVTQVYCGEDCRNVFYNRRKRASRAGYFREYRRKQQGRCESRDPQTNVQCTLPHGHDGQHTALI